MKTVRKKAKREERKEGKWWNGQRNVCVQCIMCDCTRQRVRKTLKRTCLNQGLKATAFMGRIQCLLTVPSLSRLSIPHLASPSWALNLVANRGSLICILYLIYFPLIPLSIPRCFLGNGKLYFNKVKPIKYLFALNFKVD